jgi:hypothetical protein
MSLGLRRREKGLSALLIVASLALGLPGLAQGSGRRATRYRPEVTSLEPKRGRVLGGTEITILGDFLEEVRSVRFGTTAAKFVEQCEGICEIFPYTMLTVKSPPHEAGTVNVTVDTAQGTSRMTRHDRFTYFKL